MLFIWVLSAVIISAVNNCRAVKSSELKRGFYGSSHSGVHFEAELLSDDDCTDISLHD